MCIRDRVNLGIKKAAKCVHKKSKTRLTAQTVGFFMNNAAFFILRFTKTPANALKIKYDCSAVLLYKVGNSGGIMTGI